MQSDFVRSSPSSNNEDVKVIILFESDSSVGETRKLLLASAGANVVAITKFSEICSLEICGSPSLLILSLQPNEGSARQIAAFARHRWPSAHIVLLGAPSADFEDPLYDESLPLGWSPGELVKLVATT